MAFGRPAMDRGGLPTVAGVWGVQGPGGVPIVTVVPKARFLTAASSEPTEGHASHPKTAREGGSLRPKSCPGEPPKADERARRLLEADLRERPAATLAERHEYLRGSPAGLDR